MANRQKGENDTFLRFREKAEALLREGTDSKKDFTGDLSELIEELAIHQSEVEIQSEELRRVQDELAELNRRYEEHCEFAPCGYVALDRSGFVESVNIAGASLLGIERGAWNNMPFRTFLDPGSEGEYLAALGRIKESKRKENVELKLSAEAGGAVWVRADIAPDLCEDGEIRSYRMILSDITERKLAEEALSQQRELLQNIFDNIPVMLVMWDARLKRFELNRHVETVLGWTTAEANEGDFMSKVYPDEDYRAEVSACMRSLRPGWREWRATAKAGDDVPCDWANIRLSDDTMVGIGVDLRDRRKAEEALREREERLHLFVEHAPVALAMFDSEMRYISVSSRWLKDYGLEGKDVIGLSHYRIFPEITERWKEIHRRGLSGEIVEAEEDAFARLDGSVQWLRWVVLPWRTSAGAIGGIVIFTEDITYRKNAEEYRARIKERQALLAQVAERLLRAENPQAVVEDLCRLVMEHLDCQLFFNYLVEDQGNSMRLNAFAGIPEESADEIRRLDFGVAVSGCVAQERRRVVAEDIQNGEDFRTRLVKSFGAQAYCCHPLIAQDKLVGTLSFGTRTRPAFTDDEVDLMKSVCDQVSVAMQRLLAQNELKKFNETLERQVSERTELAEARARKLQALAVELIEAEERERKRIAHVLHEDLQQVLAAAQLQLRIGMRNPSDASELETAGDMLEEGIKKSRRLAHELSPPVLHHFGLSDSILWLADRMREQFGLRVELETDFAENLDASLKAFLFRAAQEFLFNAVKHAEATAAKVELFVSDGDLVLSVADEGRGFDPASMEAKDRKAGFGLLTVKERADYFGGSLAVESAPGRGSRFALKVPANAWGVREPRPPECPTDSAPGSLPESAKASDPGLRVLFADDHKIMRQGLVRLISSSPGIAVAGEAENGREAVEKARLLKPDVILMDVSMPEMDGVEATRRIKAEMPEARVIGLSMHADEKISEAMRKAGAESFVSKTASPAELLKAIYGTG